MSPELVFLLRLALLGAIVVGLEFIVGRHAQLSRNRVVRFVQPDPVVRFRVSGGSAQRVVARRVEADTLHPVNPIVRLEPLPHKTDHVTEKRAA